MSHFTDIQKRFGINSNLPEPQFEKPIVSLSEAERAFLMSEKKWKVDHISLTEPPIEAVEPMEDKQNEKL
jgi:hypothetical protein